MREIRSAVGERERRFLPIAAAGVTVRAKGDSAKTIEGYGALFNSETVIGSWFREVIRPGAFADSLKADDVRIFFNHDPNYILGRVSAGTATVEEDDKGLLYTAMPPASRADVMESIERKDVTGSSFQFIVEGADDEEWDYSETKQGMLPLRIIKKARILETGPVALPAYEDTTVSARAASRVEEARQQHEAAVAAAPATEHTEPPAEMPLDLLERELDLLELE
jgi:HK97 family phage prohead protease